MINEQEAIEYLKQFSKLMKKWDATEISSNIDTVLSLIKEQEEEIDKVLELIFQYGQIDGAHHKMWVIDQIVRILTKEKYKEWVKEYMYDEDTGEYYSWDKGIAP